MADPTFNALEAFKKDGTKSAELIIAESKLCASADDPKGEYERG